jgi:hypothetical protein
MTDIDIEHQLTYNCDRCGRRLPRNDVSRLLHLRRHHPHLYQQVEDTYLDEIARLNDVSRRELARETEGLGAELTRLAQRASAVIDA